MTVIDLQNALKDALENEVFPKLSLFGAREMKIFLQDLPLDMNFEDDEQPDKNIPFVVIKYPSFEIKTPDDAQETTIQFIICSKDEDNDMSGYQNTVISMDRIINFLSENRGILEKFRLAYPIKGGIIEEVGAPYFMGIIETKWVTAIEPYADVQKFL